MTQSTLTDAEFTVTGMTCGSCQRRVQNALAAVPGVHQAEVDLSRSKARVRFDSAVGSKEDLVAAVRSAGYEVGEAGREGGAASGGCGCGCG